MRRGFAFFSLGLLTMLFVGDFLPAKALVARLPSTPERLVMADCIVTGKVAAVEDKEIEAAPAPGAPAKVSYKVVSIQVTDALLGAKGVTHVRVGFVPTATAGPRRPIRPGFNPQLKVGQEGCFFLIRHHEADFFVLPTFGEPLDSKAEGYDKQLGLVKKGVQLLADPLASLKAKDASDRLLAAGLLVLKYRSVRPGATGQSRFVPIAADESKLILQSLLEADWDKEPDGALAPLTVFMRLGLQPKDGFKYPQAKPGDDYNKLLKNAARDWLKDHASTYRIEKIVADGK